MDVSEAIRYSRGHDSSQTVCTVPRGDAQRLFLTAIPLAGHNSKKRQTSVAKLANGDQTICTWDGLLQTRAAEGTTEEPIVAYPSSGAEYVYYAPFQVGHPLPVFVRTR